MTEIAPSENDHQRMQEFIQRYHICSGSAAKDLVSIISSARIEQATETELKIRTEAALKKPEIMA